ncbi:MAG: FGGY family carbohydrate kinase [Acidimicrobiaceae bacterium]|nr:FGGY family carbohydrate kinase [Acidimicrobiaceae bacterium]
MSAAGSGSASGGEPTAEVVLGLDAGTSSAKAVVVDRAGRILVAAGSDPIDTSTAPDGASEQDPAAIWQAVTTAGRRAVGGLGSGIRVVSLAVAAQSGSVMPVPAGGFAERAITWMDTRSRPVVEGWPPEVAERIRAVSGWAPAPGAGLPTIAWLQAACSNPHSEAETEPRADPSVRHAGSAAGTGLRAEGGSAPPDRWASVDDYLVFRLAGQWATNPSNASGMQLMDVATRTWSPELCRVAGVDPSVLSPILESGTAAGGLTSEAAAALGLEPGTPVVVGGHDQACAALGLGAVEPGDVFLSAGTAWVLTLVTDQADVAALPPALNLSPHVAAGRWTASTNLGGLGALIAESPPDRTAAVFETCARKVGEALEAAGGMASGGGAMVVVGGGTRLGELIEMVARAAGRPVVVRPDASWPAVGAARLAAAALGWAPQRPSEERATGENLGGEPSEAVARAARERSEHERE